jgi:hypothetical protein
MQDILSLQGEVCIKKERLLDALSFYICYNRNGKGIPVASGPLLLLASSSGCCLRLFFTATPMRLESLVVWLIIFVLPFVSVSNEDQR